MKTKHYFLIIILLVLWSQRLLAQDSLVYKSVPLVNLKFDLLPLINPEDASVVGGIEYFVITERVSLGHSLGFVTDIRSYEHVDVVKSFNIGNELRVYLPLFTSSNAPTPYISGSYHFGRLTVNERYILGYECEGRCVYYRNYEGDFEMTRHQWKIHWGIQGTFTSRIFYEFDIAVGRSDLTLDRSGLDGGIFLENNRFLDEDAFSPRPSMSFSGKIGYHLIWNRKTR